MRYDDGRPVVISYHCVLLKDSLYAVVVTVLRVRGVWYYR